MNNRCTAITKSGETCRNFALHNEDKCITHSQSPRAQAARKRRKILSRNDMIFELQRQLRSVKKSEEDPVEVSKEVRLLLIQIMELRGMVEPEVDEGEEKQVRQKKKGFEETVREVQRELDEKKRNEEESEEIL